ncbi:MAG: hypothetical protein Q8M74_03750 [Chloroflexota bacterium]|nr:hypothetical protein [Chloroflexota bacterium]
MTSEEKDPTVVVDASVRIVALVGGAVRVDREVRLAADQGLAGGYAACVADDGSFLAADNGGSFHYVADGVARRIPAQDNNLGSCAWIDQDHAIWDQEDRRIAIWDRGSQAIRYVAGVSGEDPTSGGGRTAIVSRSNVLHIVSLDASTGMANTLEGDTLEGVSRAALSGDGQWLLVWLLHETIRLYRVDATGLHADAEVSIEPGQGAIWATAWSE